MNLKWVVYVGPDGLKTDPVLQVKDIFSGYWTDVPVEEVKSDKHYHHNTKIKRHHEK